MSPALGTSSVKLLARSGKLVSVSKSEVALQVTGEHDVKKTIRFAINEDAQLEPVKPGDIVTVIYTQYLPKDVLVRLFKPGRHPSTPGTPPEPLGVALLQKPVTGVQPISDQAAALILADAKEIKPIPDSIVIATSDGATNDIK